MHRDKKEKKEKDPIDIFCMIKKIYPMCFKTKPSYYIFCHSVGLCQGLLTGASVMVVQIFFDAIYNASIGENTVGGVILALMLFVSVKLSDDLINALLNFSINVKNTRITGFMNSEINKKSALIDPVEYENPKRLDDINKAANGTGAAIGFETITSLTFTLYLPYFAFMGFYLTNLKPTLILCLLFVFVPVLTAQILRSAVFSKLEDKVAPIRREVDAYKDAASGKGFYKETRNLGSFKYLKNLLVDTLGSLNAAIWRANKRSALIDLLFNTLSLMGYGGILFLLVKYLLDGEISVGAFAAVYGSIGMLFGIMHNMITQHFGNLADNFGLIRNFLRFLDIPTDRRAKLTISKKDGIAIENASFRYPNAEKDSLKNINLAIKPGETIAIVGENGAGKTTLVKLLTGLYKPTEGSVKIGETDVNTISYRSLFENVSGVFQKYQRYALTLKENVQIADFESENNVEKTLEENHIDKDDKDTFPNGLDTMLSREFDGVDLSGGEWQRVAIARGFYRDSDIIVLDEPTAAIDPIEESAIYKKFVEIAKEKTAVIAKKMRKLLHSAAKCGTIQAYIWIRMGLIMNNPFLKRILGLSLAVLLFCSCSQSASPDKPGDGETPTSDGGAQTGDPEGDESVFGERLKVPDGIEEEDMGGMKFRILLRDSLKYEFHIEEETGENVEDAIYGRNKKIEDRFNVRIVNIPVNNPSDDIGRAVKAGEDAYDLIAHNMVNLAGISMTKVFVDFNSIPTMDLSQRWFLQDAVSELSINNKIYILPGEACLTILEAAYCYYFNKALVADFAIEDPYQLVLEGKWTLDKFGEIIKGLYKDLDNDGKKSPGDFYGFSTFNVSHPVTYTYSSGMRITKNNAEGVPEFVVPSERLYSNFAKVYGLVCNNPDTFGAKLEEQALIRPMFSNRQAVFLSEVIWVTKNFRDMEDDFGLVPFPKYDEAQEKYYTFSDGYASMMAIPITVRDVDRVGKIVTALNAESWKTVIPQYYDVAIKVKFVRDDESVRVLDMLLDGRVFDFGYIYDWERNAYGFYMWDLIAKNSDKVASYFEKKTRAADKYLEKVLKTFED